MKSNIILLTLILISASIHSYSQQASLTIINKSDRNLTVKIMQGMGRKATFYKKEYISPKGTQITYFSETGKYFTKSQAILVKEDTLQNDTLFSKSNPFEVISDIKRGYSNITMKFTVKESKKPIIEGVLPISRKEYEEN